MGAWMLGFPAGPVVLAGFGVYLCLDRGTGA
jgi:hypothetical protein